MKHHIAQLASFLYMPVVEGMRLGDMAKGDPVPEGIYHARIAKVEQKISDPSDKDPDPYPYQAITYVLCGSSPEEHHGRHIFENLTMKPGANFSLRQVFEALGYTEDTDVVEVLARNELIDGELMIAVDIEKERKDPKTGRTYGARNNVRKRMALQA